jgi:transposase
MRKKHSKELKFKVAIEAIRGDLTMAQIVSKYQISESLIYRWKKELLEKGSKVFGKEWGRSCGEPSLNDLEKLHATIGRLKLENDFLDQALSKVR